MKQVRAIVCTLLVLFTFISVMPVMSVTAAAAVTDRPTFIYLYKDYEAQKEGAFPYGLGQATNSEYGDPFGANMVWNDACFVTSKPENDGTPNKAAVLKGANDKGSSEVRLSMIHRPIKENFVLSFKTQVNDTRQNRLMQMHYDVVDYHGTYFGNYCDFNNFIMISDKITVNGTTVFENVQKDTWYDIDILIKRSASAADVYINGQLAKSGVQLPNIKYNVSAFALHRPDADGSDWYFDDLKIYIADSILPDEEVKADWDEYRANEWAVPEMVDTGIRTIYDTHAYHTTYNKFIMCVNGIRFYKDNKFYVMPQKLREKDGKIFVPVRAFAESFGATVGYSDGTITIEKDGDTMKVVPGSDIYYVNDSPSKLYELVYLENGNAMIQLEVISNFFDVAFERYDDIVSFSGPLEIPYTELDPIPYLMEQRTVSDNVMDRIRMKLLFNTPSAEEVMVDFGSASHGGKHPYIRFTDFDQIKKNMEREEGYARVVNDIIKKADNLLATPDPDTGKPPWIVQHKLKANGATFYGIEEIRNIGMYCSFAYKMTGDKKYKDYLWLQIDAMKDPEVFPDLLPITNNLNLGRPAYGLYAAYDWLYDDWTEEERAILEEEIYRLVLIPTIRAYQYQHHTNWVMWTYGYTNTAFIDGGGVMGCAMALLDKYPELCSQLISSVLDTLQHPFDAFKNDGSWEEGSGYWSYSVEDIPMAINAALTCLEDDYGLIDAYGMDKTAYFVSGMSGALGSFPFGDDYIAGWNSSYLMFHARQFNDPKMAAYYKPTATGFNSLENWVWDEEIGGTGAFNVNDLPEDNYWIEWENAVMRSGRANGDTQAVLHGGYTTGPHTHVDSGSFQFDMLGVRWAGDVPKQDYYTSNRTPAGLDPVYYYDVYYRNKAEGHNTVVANMQHSLDMEYSSFVPIVKKEFTEVGSYAIADMTQTNKVYDVAVRGMRLDKVTGNLIVQDDFTAKEPSEFLWSMHTLADIQISEDGRSAILTEQVKKGDEIVKTGKRIWMGIISDDDHKLGKMKAEPLEGYYDIPTWQDSLGPENNLLGDCPIQWHKLIIQAKDTTKFKVSVGFAPLAEGETVPSVMPTYIPMEKWKFESVERAEASGVTIDGEALASFEPGVYTYDINVMTEKTPIPKIQVTSDEYEVEMREATVSPGTTVALLKKNGEIMGKYTFVITPLNDTSTFLNDKQIPIVGYTAPSEPEPTNITTNLFDGLLTTKLATDDNEGAVTLDFGSVKEVHDVKIAFMDGYFRKEYFIIYYSTDGVNFTECYRGNCSGETAEHESYVIDVNARYIRVQFQGNSGGTNWVSPSELCAFTK